LKNIGVIIFFRRLIGWFWRGRYHILTISVLIITFCYLSGRLKFFPYLVASVFSITGLLIILTQLILDARKYKDQKPNTFLGWIRSFPTNKPILITPEGGRMTMRSDNVTLTFSPSPDSTIEYKIELLFKQLHGVQTALGNLENLLQDMDNNNLNKFNEINSSLNNLKSSLSSLIAGHVVGDYDKTLFAIIITICGTLIQVFS
jgi:hypothetical protein